MAQFFKELQAEDYAGIEDCPLYVEVTPNGERWNCPHCKTPIDKDDDVMPKRACQKSPELIRLATIAAGRLNLLDAAGQILEDAWHYAGSLAKWAWAVCPFNTPEETARRASICWACDKIIDGKCGICNCPVKEKRGMIVKNKAAMGTEFCPHPDGSKWLKNS